ncbi:hypothetical protein C8Q75DRAFT_789594 [Abortiporus biennis]|nr:hypothetical protein C8Q75DRAFT_789594 [Abortiporus biennis]
MASFETMQRPLKTHLPFDILCAIFDQIDGKVSLLSTSLVCRSWFLAGRPTIFRSITIEAGDMEKGVDAFINAMDNDKLPLVKDHCRNLQIRYTRQRWYTQTSERPAVTANKVAHILNHLRLRSLTLDCVNIAVGTELPPLQLGKHQLKHLTFRRVAVHRKVNDTPGRALYNFLRIFSRVDEMDLEIRSFESLPLVTTHAMLSISDIAGFQQKASPLDVKKLSLIFTYQESSYVYPIINHLLNPTSLYSVSMDCYSEESTEIIKNLVSESEHNLREIVIRPRCGMAGRRPEFREILVYKNMLDYSIKTFNISTCNLLSNITLHFGTYRTDTPLNESVRIWSTINGILSCESRTIEYVQINWAVHEDKEVQWPPDMNWGNIDSIASRFVALKEFRVVGYHLSEYQMDYVSGGDVQAKLVTGIRDRLPVLQGQGLLKLGLASLND